MPSSSKKQHNFMAAIAHSPSFAKKVGVSQSVGKDFNTADKGKTFNKGGMMKMRKFAEAGYVDDSDMDDEGNTRSKYEIDPDSRRAHGLYDEKPASKKSSKKPTKNSKALDYELTREALAREKARDVAAKRNYEKDVRPGLDMADIRAPTESKNGSKILRVQKGSFSKGGMPMKDGKPAFMQKKMNMGGMAKYAKGGGIESRGKTKGTVIRMAAGGSVSRRADGIAQRGKTKFTNY